MEGGGDGGSEFSLLSSKAKAKAPPTKPVVSLEGGKYILHLNGGYVSKFLLSSFFEYITL